MRSFNLSALAVRERAITLFFIFASACAGSPSHLAQVLRRETGLTSKNYRRQR